MILADSEILAARERGEIVIDPWRDDCLGPNSYDVHLSEHLAVYSPPGTKFDSARDNPVDRLTIKPEGVLLRPGTLYLASTVEYTETWKHVPYLDGKCFASGTKVWMADGTLRNVEDIVPGDAVLGVRGLRHVQEIHSGLDEMYRVTQSRGVSYVVNGQHLLSLICGPGIDNKRFPEGAIVEVAARDFVSLPENVRRHLYGYRRPAPFDGHGDLPLDPYLLGVWLGDGTTGAAEVTINNGDTEILDLLRDTFPLAKFYQYKPGAKTVVLSTHEKKSFRRPNDFLDALRLLGVANAKSIPECYLIASFEDRQQLLAGLLDTDGSPNHCGWEISTALAPMRDGIARLAQSLGFTVSIADKTVNGVVYHRLNISGNVASIPTKLARKNSRLQKPTSPYYTMSRIEVEPVGVGAFHGFSLNPSLVPSVDDPLFFLEDFTVAHNSGVGRLGIFIHATAGRGDVGFCGHWTMEISVVEPVRVHAGMPIGQLTYHAVQGQVRDGNRYDERKSSSYNGERDPLPQPSRLWRKFATAENVTRAYANAWNQRAADDLSETSRRNLGMAPKPTCQVCGKPVREGLVVCAGLSECWLSECWMKLKGVSR